MGVFSIWHWIIVLFIIIIVVASLWIFIWKKNKNLINKYDEKSRLKRGSYAIRGIPTVFLINVFGNLMGQGQVALPIGIIGLIISSITASRRSFSFMSGEC